METHAYRQARIGVEIPIIVTTVLDSLDAAIADLSQYGAQITGCTLAPATRFQIEYMGQTVYAQCRWSEVDRMGVKFFYPLVDGPLFERFMIAQASQIPSQAQSGTAMAYSQMQIRPGAGSGRAFGRAPQAAFGRRAG
jgi:hypothetical protein